jgi:primosomal protein N' (replication factor Y)
MRYDPFLSSSECIMSSNLSSVKAPSRVSVLLPVPLRESFDYSSDVDLAPGTVVKVPFGPRELYGVVWGNGNASSLQALKPLVKVVEETRLPDVSLKFIEWVSDYTMTPRGQILKMVLAMPEAFEKERKKAESTIQTPCKPQLSAEQCAAAEHLTKSLEAESFHTFLLEGVTGSGKTEVYFEAIEFVLRKEGQALVLLPEIALSAQWLQRFEVRFGFSPAIWHSDLPLRQRVATFQALLRGEVRVIVGTRSALFLPFQALKLLIVDEEHDGSYKQEEGVIYNARDMAVVRAQLSQATCILASATPSLETESNVLSGKYHSIQLTSRYGEAEMPEVKLLDMRKVKMAPQTWISPLLRGALEKTLHRGEQAMLFLNRRGYAPLTLCRSCGDRIMCPQCSISLVHHRSQDKLLCHHCGHIRSKPSSCPACQEEGSYSLIGPGVERIHEEVSTFLPEARYALLTSDHLTTSKKIAECVQKIQEREVDILIGTQLMAKGHHFPFLTLVGIIDGDSALSGSDLRASEKSFQLLHQVSGRSGREARRGQVVLQTYLPDHPLMHALTQHNRTQFFSLESEQRQLHGFPPYGRLVALILSGRKNEEVQKAARLLAKKFPLTERAELLGPTAAPLSYLRGRHRWRLLVKTAKDFPPQPLLRHWLASASLPSSIKLQIDIDPYSFF